MDFRRFLKIIGVLIALLILFMIARSIFGRDEVKPNLGQLILVNQQLVDLSDAAKSELGGFDLQVAAANVLAVIASDNQLLSAYYSENHGKPPALGKSTETALTKLEGTPTGSPYDTKFTQLANELEVEGRRLAQTIVNDSSSQELDGLLTSYIEHLDTLFQ